MAHTVCIQIAQNTKTVTHFSITACHISLHPSRVKKNKCIIHSIIIIIIIFTWVDKECSTLILEKEGEGGSATISGRYTIEA